MSWSFSVNATGKTDVLAALDAACLAPNSHAPKDSRLAAAASALVAAMPDGLDLYAISTNGHLEPNGRGSATITVSG